MSRTALFKTPCVKGGTHPVYKFITYLKEQIPIIGKYLSGIRKLDHVLVLKAGFETQL